jgi:anti-sigma-K factor RskA
MSADEYEYDELLGAYALDALEPAESRAVEEYLRISPAAVVEVQRHREVASMLAWTSMEAPAGLWERITASIEGQDAAPPQRVADVLPLRRARRVPVAAMAMLSAAAAAVLAVVLVNTMRTDSDRTPMAQAFQAALDDRDSLTAELANEAGTRARAVVDADGHGYLELSGLPALADDKTYQLWGVIDGEPISLGIFGPNPELETFSATGNLTTLVITTEEAGGVISDGNMDGALVGELG